MRKLARKVLERDLHTAIEKVLKDNKAETKIKTEKVVIKSIKKIAKNTDLNITVAVKKKQDVLARQIQV